MGKEKIEEKDVRLLRYAVEQAFDGAMRDGALALLNRLVDSASEAANLEEELLNLKGEYQRSMENSKRGAFKRLDAVYKRKCRREKRMAKGQMPGRRFRKRMLPTKKRCPRCGRVLPAEAFNLVRGGRELAGWCRVCNHRYYLDRKEAGFVRKNPSGRRIAHGRYTDAVGRYIDLG